MAFLGSHEKPQLTRVGVIALVGSLSHLRHYGQEAGHSTTSRSDLQLRVLYKGPLVDVEASVVGFTRLCPRGIEILPLCYDWNRGGFGGHRVLFCLTKRTDIVAYANPRDWDWQHAWILPA